MHGSLCSSSARSVESGTPPAGAAPVVTGDSYTYARELAMEPSDDDSQATLPYDVDTGIVPPTGGRQFTYGELARDRNKSNWYLPAGCVVLEFGNAIDEADKTFLKGYFQKLLVGRGCKGLYKLWGIQSWKGYIMTFKFDKEAMCPLHMERHGDSYGFEYKVKNETYGGWKCWKEDGWETHYDFGELNRLTRCTPTKTSV